MKYLLTLALAAAALYGQAAQISFKDITSTNTAKATDQLLLNSSFGGGTYSTRTVTVSNFVSTGGAPTFRGVTNALSLTGDTSKFVNGAGALASPSGGSSPWTNVSGVIKPASGQTTNVLSFTSGLADNATNIAVAVNTATPWTDESASLFQGRRAGTNTYRITPLGGMISGVDAESQIYSDQGSSHKIALGMRRTVSLGDNPNWMIDFGSSAAGSIYDRGSDWIIVGRSNYITGGFSVDSAAGQGAYMNFAGGYGDAYECNFIVQDQEFNGVLHFNPRISGGIPVGFNGDNSTFTVSSTDTATGGYLTAVQNNRTNVFTVAFDGTLGTMPDLLSFVAGQSVINGPVTNAYADCVLIGDIVVESGIDGYFANNVGIGYGIYNGGVSNVWDTVGIGNGFMFKAMNVHTAYGIGQDSIFGDVYDSSDLYALGSDAISGTVTNSHHIVAVGTAAVGTALHSAGLTSVDNVTALGSGAFSFAELTNSHVFAVGDAGAAPTRNFQGFLGSSSYEIQIPGTLHVASDQFTVAADGTPAVRGVPGITTTWTNVISGVITQRITAVGGLIVTNLTL